MDEYEKGTCIACKTPIYIDEGYTVIKDNGPLSEYVCEACKPCETKCPICDDFYDTKEEAQRCFKACAGMNQ